MNNNRPQIPRTPETGALVATVSERVRVLHEARKAVLEARPERGDRIRDLTRKVKAGTYHIDGRAVAEAIARQSTGSNVA
ncbi:MAG: flagellar biosynthesis anti-sigma factor FlgM [Nitrospirota bacterium]|nr:flagellar biosynthesis anti-sigma factor FlgM [Nitrospirota bacterium]